MKGEYEKAPELALGGFSYTRSVESLLGRTTRRRRVL
jgi:hypothetical protein